MIHLSIITASLNSGSQLFGCIESVRKASDDCGEIEHVIVDGGSTDRTVKLLQESERAGLRWASAPDTGISEAMNRGIALANGEWLLFLHSDDRLVDGARLAKDRAQADQWEQDTVALYPVFATFSGVVQIIPPRPERLWRKTPGCHQGMIFHRSLFERYGTYDCDLKICMDYDLLLRLHHKGVRLRAYDRPFARFDTGGISSTSGWRMQRARFLEERIVHLRHARGLTQRRLYQLYWFCYYPYRRMVNFLQFT